MIVKAVLRREPSMDFPPARVARWTALPDENVLALAATSGRLLVTHDRRTMPGHFARFIAANTSPGVGIVPQSMPVQQAADELLLVWMASGAKEWNNRIAVLPLQRRQVRIWELEDLKLRGLVESPMPNVECPRRKAFRNPLYSGRA